MPDVLEQHETIPQWLDKVKHCPSCGDALIGVPVLRCAHCGAERPLRAFYYKVSDGYIAECIDLDLMSQGKTKEEAIKSLQEAMYGYLQVAFSGESTKGLVLRLSPLSHRIHYHARKFFCRIISTRHQHFMLPNEQSGKHNLCHC
jgi:predicted RNase H-like HicB family nuclease